MGFRYLFLFYTQPSSHRQNVCGIFKQCLYTFALSLWSMEIVAITKINKSYIARSCRYRDRYTPAVYYAALQLSPAPCERIRMKTRGMLLVVYHFFTKQLTSSFIENQSTDNLKKKKQNLSFFLNAKIAYSPTLAQCSVQIQNLRIFCFSIQLLVFKILTYIIFYFYID